MNFLKGPFRIDNFLRLMKSEVITIRYKKILFCLL